MFIEVALAITGLAGMAGFWFAYAARGEVIELERQLIAANAATTEAKSVAFEAGARAVAAETRLADALSRLGSAETDLDNERRAKQSLVDALTKAGVPVGDLAVDVAVDRLYEDGGGQSPRAGSGTDSDHLPDGTPAVAPAPAKG